MDQYRTWEGYLKPILNFRLILSLRMSLYPPSFFFSSLLFFVLTNFAVWNHHVANIPITSVDDPSLKQTTKTCPFPATR